MSTSREDILRQLATAHVANEAEVETKIVLHLLRLLGYSDVDRADKVTVRMQFGREVRTKVADFVLYNGGDRSLPNALLTVETKAVGESIEGAESQARSYATWAGTPFIMVCNGQAVLVAQFLPGTGTFKSLTVPVERLVDEFDRIREIVGRAEAVLAKERLSYLGEYLPDVERLPPAEFLREYLTRLVERFRWTRIASGPLSPPTGQTGGLLQIPVNARRTDSEDDRDFGVPELSAMLLEQGQTSIFVTGQPGTGKSTLCRRLAASLAETSINEPMRNVIPIYLELGRGVPNSPSAAFHRACEDLGVRVFPELYKRVLERGVVILLLDGLDEVPGGATVAASVDALIGESKSVPAVVTSRPELSPDVVGSRCFIHFRVRRLTDAELGSVLLSHVHSEQTVKELINASSAGVIPDLHSAMTALMAVRVANEIPNWSNLSAYHLYVEYVGVLHGYFNAPSVRGADAAHVVSRDEVISALSSAAVTLRQAQTDGYAMKFGEVVAALVAADCRGVKALLNCGLLTSDGGRATFVHRSFEDFGLAVRIVEEVRREGVSGLAQRHLTDESYRLAASELGDGDEPILIVGLTHTDQRIRKAASALLSRMKVSPEADEALWHRMAVEPSDYVWPVMARGLLGTAPGRFQSFLATNAGQLSSKRLSSVAWAIRRMGDFSFLQTLLSAFEQASSRHLALAAFELAIATDDDARIEQLVTIYSKLNGSGRRSVARLLQRRGGALRDQLILRLIEVEDDVRSLIRLLIGPAFGLMMSNESLTMRFAAILGDTTQSVAMHRRERRHLRNVARYLRGLKSPSGATERLAQACEWRGRKMHET